MDKKDREVLLKIEKHIRHAIDYTVKYDSLNAFEQDEMCVEATVFNLMQIGELTKFSLSDDYKQSIQTIPWKQMYGMRNRIVHGYDGVDLKIVWDTVKEDLPDLLVEIRGLIQ